MEEVRKAFRKSNRLCGDAVASDGRPRVMTQCQRRGSGQTGRGMMAWDSSGYRRQTPLSPAVSLLQAMRCSAHAFGRKHEASEHVMSQVVMIASVRIRHSTF